MNDRVDEEVEVDGFRDHRIEPRAHGARAVFGARMAGARDGRRPAALVVGKIAHTANQLVAVLARHADI